MTFFVVDADITNSPIHGRDYAMSLITYDPSVLVNVVNDWHSIDYHETIIINGYSYNEALDYFTEKTIKVVNELFSLNKSSDVQVDIYLVNRDLFDSKVLKEWGIKNGYDPIDSGGFIELKNGSNVINFILYDDRTSFNYGYTVVNSLNFNRLLTKDLLAEIDNAAI